MHCTDGGGAAATIVCIVTPADWRVYISPALIAISATIAFLAMRTTRAVARQRATLDLIEKRESTEHYRRIADGFSRVRRADGFAALGNPRTEEERAARACVVDYLNHYELISIGILNGILDERIYRTWMRGPFTRDWNAAAGWVQRERWKRGADGAWHYYPHVFANYGRLARRWSPDAMKLQAGTAGPPSAAEAGGPGDERLPVEPPG